MNHKILLMPAFRTPREAYAALARVIWYCGPLQHDIGMITAFYAGNDIVDLEVSAFCQDPNKFLPDHFADDIAPLTQSFRTLIQVLPDETGLLRDSMFDHFGLILHWTSARPDDAQNMHRFSGISGAAVVQTDPGLFPDALTQATVAIDHLRRFGRSPSSSTPGDTEADLTAFKHARSQVAELVKRNQGKSVTLLGGAIEGMDHADLRVATQDRITIIDEGPVMAPELCDIVEPDAICLSNLPLVIGLARQSSTFRAALISTLEHYDCSVICDWVIQSYLSVILPAKFHHRLLAIPRDHGDLNLDLMAAFRTKEAASDGLTAFMLPLALTLSRDVQLIGFSGPDTMTANPPQGPGDSLAIHYPAYYDRQYRQVPWVALDKELRVIFRSASSRGVRLRNLQPSSLPALAEIYTGFE